MMYANKQQLLKFKQLPVWLILTWLCSTSVHAQQVVVKTNLLGWSTTTPNLGVEVRLSSAYTLQVAGSYNSWNYSGNTALRHILFQPEVRYWFSNAFQKHFIGAHLHVADYNIGDLPLFSSTKDYQYRGQLYGAGVSYGYHFPLNARWSMEATLGLGYAYMNYKKYLCHQCAEIRSTVRRHYVGPTKAALSLIYLIH